MIRSLFHLIRSGNVTQRDILPDLAPCARGLPMLTDVPCGAAQGCSACTDSCPTDAITAAPNPGGGRIMIDLGKCVACAGCVEACPTGTIRENRSTRVAVRTRGELVMSNEPRRTVESPSLPTTFRRSIHIREVSTGDNASDLEVAAANNAIFDSSRFGIHFVASPRFADALIVTGPVGHAMREPLLRCYEAMAEPRMVIAVGASAISGGLHCGGYAVANGVQSLLPVSVYVPGHPPHPWYILHGILLAADNRALRFRAEIKSDQPRGRRGRSNLQSEESVAL